MSFTLDLSRLVVKAKGNIEIEARKIIIELFSAVVMKSPVDIGRFRANWMVGYAAPNVLTSESTDKDGSATVDKIAAEVAITKIDGKSIFLTNSLPYSIRLENGYSKQAPQGMVRLSLVEITTHYGV